MCNRVDHAAVTAKTRKYQVSIIIAYGESECKTGLEKSSSYLGSAAPFPSYSLNYPCNCCNSPVTLCSEQASPRCATSECIILR